MVMIEGKTLLNLLVKCNLNSFCSPAEKYNISNRRSPRDREIVIIANYLLLSFFCFHAALTGELTE